MTCRMIVGIRHTSIATPDGIVVAAPHYMAQGMVEAMVEVGVAPKNSRRQYDDALFDASEALEKIDARVGSFEHTIAAFHRWK